MNFRRYFTTICGSLFLAVSMGCSDDPWSALTTTEGEWTFVNYWAIWCHPCIKEIPELNEIDDLENMRVLGVNFDGVVGEELREQAAKLGIEFALLEQDPAAKLGTTRPEVLPTTLILNADGVVVASLIGPQTKETLLAAIPSAEDALRNQ